MSDRVNLGNGRWFDRAAATAYSEATYWDGRNRVSKATGSQWEHEKLYRTKSGTWILYSWSQWQGSRPSYNIVSESAAHRWLIDAGYGDDVAGFDGALKAAEL